MVIMEKKEETTVSFRVHGLGIVSLIFNRSIPGRVTISGAGVHY